MKSVKKHILLIFLGIISGIIGGLCGVVFSKSIGFVTNIRTENNRMLYLLPIGGLISVGIYKLCRVKNIGTTNVFESVRTEQTLPRLLAPAVFFGTCISHLFGASSGREGAALQIGGGVANVASKFFKLDEDSKHIAIMCGMSALFAAVFGTPLAACVFVLEVIITQICVVAAVPVLISSVTAYATSQLLHVHPERFYMGELPTFSFSVVLKSLTITLAGVAVAFVFCKSLNLSKMFTKKFIKNEFVRIAIGGILIIGLTTLIGNYDYNGSGINVIERVFVGEVRYEAFVIKILFTVICVSCGYKGGEIVPTLFIGATLGGALGMILGLPIAIGAAIGMSILFVCVTKCPIATILLCGEMFGFYCLVLLAPLIIIGFVAARYHGLYNNPKDMLSLFKIQKKD